MILSELFSKFIKKKKPNSNVNAIKHSAFPKSEKGCTIVIGSPLEYEELVAYIHLDDVAQVLEISQEDGPDKLKVKFDMIASDGEDGLLATEACDYEKLINALEAGKNHLLRMQLPPEA